MNNAMKGTPRGCPDLECRGDCTWCNRAEIENRGIPKQHCCEAEAALRRSIEELKALRAAPPEARRILGTLEGAAAELAKLHLN